MFQKTFGALTLVALAASAATAQVSATFKFTSGGSGYNSYQGQFTSPTSSSFQVWCVDEKHYTQTGLEYDAWVSRLDGNLSKTRAADAVKYTKAAWLASNMSGSNVNTYQYAIWAIMHQGDKPHICSPWSMSTGWTNGALSGCNADDVVDAMDAASVGSSSIAASEWYVITAKNDYSNSSGQWVQEHIARCDSTPGATVNFCDQPDWPNENPTPEPATMTLLAMGLAGMAGTSLRRRRKS